jgi:hypothetical protein
MNMSSAFARCRPAFAGRVWYSFRGIFALGLLLAGLSGAAAPAAPAALKPLLVVGPQMEMDAVYNGVNTPRFVLYTEGVALFRAGGTAEKPIFARTTVTAEQLKLFQIYMDDFFLNPEFGEGFENVAAKDLALSFCLEARYAKGPVEILVRNVRMEEMEYNGSQLHVNDSLAQVPVGLLRLLSLVRQVESSPNAKAVTLGADENGNPAMPGVLNTAKRVRTLNVIIAPVGTETTRLGAKTPIELPKVKVDGPSTEPAKAIPLIGPEEYRK